MRDTGPAAAEASAGDAPGLEGVSPSGIRDLLARLAGSVASAIDTRVELAALEYAEERERFSHKLVLGAVTAIAAGLALLAANALFVVALWDRLGWLSLALLVFAWLVVASVAGWRLANFAQRERRPFDATLAELARDRDWIVERFGRRDR